jgi:hypothetical protein
MTVVTFTDYTPVPRFDGIPWTTVMIEESDSEGGPWTLIDTQNLTPVDSDPTNPMSRNITTDNATLAVGVGWYIVSFGDVNNNVQDTPPTFNGIPIEWTPTLQDVGHVVLSRTRDSNGTVLGTFTSDTQPTDEEVRVLIQKAIDDVMPLIGTDIPEELISEAQNVASIRTAMYIELTFYANEVAMNRSVYPELKALFDEKVATLAKAVAAIESGESPTDALAGAGGDPFYAYPPQQGFMYGWGYFDPWLRPF